MKTSTLFCALMALSALTLLSACGGHVGRGDLAQLPAREETKSAIPPSGDSEPHLSGLQALADPLSLLRRSSTTPPDIDRLKAYNYWDPALPHANVTNGNYSPTGGASLGQSAYAIYRFDQLDTYDTPPQLLLSWTTPPAAGKLYVGLANFDTNRWEWRRPADMEKLGLTSFDPYISIAGNSLVILVVTGSQEAQINWLIAGGSVITTLQINSDLKPDLSLNLAPLTVNFTAYAYVYGSTVATFEWDLDGDGVYELSGSEDQASHSYDQPGSYDVRMRATCVDGTQDTAYLQVTAVNPTNTGPTAHVETSPLSSDGPAPITLDAAGSFDADGQIIKYEWDYNNDGIYDYDSGTTNNVVHIFARKGLNFYRVRVTDNDYATANVLGAVTINSGWSTATVSFGYGYIYGISAATCGVGAGLRPCVAFQNADGVDLHFVRAAAVDGSDWDAVQNPIDNTPQTGFSPALLRSGLTGNALLFYGSYDTTFSSHALHLVKAGNAAGTSWGAPIDIESELDMGGRTVAFFDDGVPALLSTRKIANNESEVYYYRAGDGTAQDWNTRYLAATALAGKSFYSLAGACVTNPVAFMIEDQNTVGFSNATAPDASQWQGFTPIDGFPSPQVLASEVNGRPAIATPHDSQIYYRRADDAAGTSWTADPVVIQAPKQIYPACMKVIGGVPALAWVSGDGDGVYLARALDVDGLSWEGPFPIVISTGLGHAIDMVDCNGNPVVVYSNDDDDTIEAAFYVP